MDGPWGQMTSNCWNSNAHYSGHEAAGNQRLMQACRLSTGQTHWAVHRTAPCLLRGGQAGLASAFEASAKNAYLLVASGKRAFVLQPGDDPFKTRCSFRSGRPADAAVCMRPILR